MRIPAVIILLLMFLVARIIDIVIFFLYLQLLIAHSPNSGTVVE